MSEAKHNKSGPKKGAQKYQNTFAYTHNKGSKLSKKILSLPIDGLCAKCFDQITWRKTYRKYKPLTVAATCVSCNQKNIKKAYHVLCDPCAETKKVCAKCMQVKEIVIDENTLIAQQLELEQTDFKKHLQGMRERVRRSYLRKLERGEITPEEVLAIQVTEDFDDFSDFSSEED
ncbi:hypothetical protein BB561_002934 [Smittium simulii]|uniref:Uncharacterized protein n=1 Tax=Smittium simulii TaxID=133385 RepID=A0A2T9YNN3_9FUNG|nr:hypothetical protein BB561_002934 [Smittium simulii]